MGLDAWAEFQMKMAAEEAFRILASCEPTDDDLNALEQQHQQAWQGQEDEDSGS